MAVDNWKETKNFQIALFEGNAEALLNSLENGADPNFEIWSGTSALIYSCQKNYGYLTLILLQFGAARELKQ